MGINTICDCLDGYIDKIRHENMDCGSMKYRE